MKIIRTDKPFTKDAMDLNFLQQAVHIGGLHKFPLRCELEKFTVTEKFINRSDEGTATKHPYREPIEGYHKYLNCVQIYLDGFDTKVSIWQEGRIQGYYNSGGAQYSADPVNWINLLLEYGFVTIEESISEKQVFPEATGPSLGIKPTKEC